MGGIKDMLSPPCQNMGGIHTPHPPGIYALALKFLDTIRRLMEVEHTFNE